MKLKAILLFAIALGGCGQPGPVSEEAKDTTILNGGETSASPSPPAGAGSTSAREAVGREPATGPVLPIGSIAIPDQYHGRWGMVPADCTPGRADAKGLMTIGERSVRFYESVATLKEQRPAIATSFSGLFAFTGEGQSWEKVMTFTRTGDTLVRAEDDGRFTYKRCS